MAPMVLDGVIQMKTAYESRNGRRLWTGLLFGYGLMTFVWISCRWSFWLGYRLMT